MRVRETCVLIEIWITSSSIISRGVSFVGLNLDKIFLPLLKILPCYEAFLAEVSITLVIYKRPLKV